MKSTAVNFDERYSSDVDEETGRFYVSFPVRNRLVEYEENYEIDQATYKQYLADIGSALSFVEECRKHHHDELLLRKPGSVRGYP